MPTIKQDIFTRLLMCFGIPILEGDLLLRNWLEQHKKANEEIFLRLLKETKGFTYYLKKNQINPIIPGANSVVYLPINGLENISDQTVRQHLQKWTDGERTLEVIATQMGKDLQTIKKIYSDWSKQNWVIFEDKIQTGKNDKPTILSVDDSLIVQTTMRRILGDRCHLLLSSNATDALHLLNKHQVSLLLLDLTMPDIDGLQVCKTLRSIPKFSDLPIIMLTARDGLFDKVKGKLVGTNRYLTKPFDAETLLTVVNEFVDCGNT